MLRRLVAGSPAELHGSGRHGSFRRGRDWAVEVAGVSAGELLTGVVAEHDDPSQGLRVAGRGRCGCYVFSCLSGGGVAVVVCCVGSGVLRGELVEFDDVVIAGDRPLVEVDLAAAVHASQHRGSYLARFPIRQRTAITLALRIAIRDLFACFVHLPGSELPEQSQPGRDEWLSVADVAAELGMHPSTVRKWANDGLLPGMRIGRRQWRFRRSALRLLERERPSGGDQAGGPVRDGSLDPLALTSDADLVEPDER